MELLQSQAKEFGLHLISNREPLKIFGSKSDGLKTHLTVAGPGLLITEGRQVLKKTPVLNPLLQLIRIIWIAADEVLS